MAASRSSCSRSSCRRLQSLGGVIQRAAGGQAGLQPVGGDRRAAVIFAIIPTANRVGHRAQAAGSAASDEVGHHGRGADALVVVADQDDIGPAHLIGERLAEIALAGERQRSSHLVIDSDHLLRMAVLCSADVAFLDRTGPSRIGQQRLVVDVHFLHHPANSLAVGVGAGDADQAHPRPKGAQHRRHTAGAAQAFLTAVGVQENYGRFLADALGVAPDVAIEHGVADDQHARLAQTQHQLGQIRFRRWGPPECGRVCLLRVVLLSCQPLLDASAGPLGVGTGGGESSVLAPLSPALGEGAGPRGRSSLCRPSRHLPRSVRPLRSCRERHRPGAPPSPHAVQRQQTIS